ncbi:hypothetical protein EXM22_03980 [Oceanispirochaeta crateris]|uniref:Uncharacterized protein n=1 Tax=Oceanispirochaeta crateris TaxID=2518645 RepID=A0A5C1QIR4_9SPIO|nr:zinc-dependent metalloprotease family protein [Oceanispirochaeta crateris]QEN07188.1 hypothetical protein EXM22_03980 [Oceanispirochaeta crateris]
MRKAVFIFFIVLIIVGYNSCELFIEDSDTFVYDDGIPDEYEQEGTSYYGMPLYDWGARAGFADLFVHIAPMEPGLDPNSSDYYDAGMLLQKSALDKVVAAFAEEGIALHFDVGSRGLYDGYTEITGRGVSQYNLSDEDHRVDYNPAITLSSNTVPSEMDATKFVFVDELKAASFPSERYQIFYFMVFGSSQEDSGDGGSSGIAYLGGRDFLITLAKWGLNLWQYDDYGFTLDEFKNRVINYQASTIMHEFGHNLGLSHGGNESLNYKPNYYSIMNYLYQIQGLPRIGSNEGDRYYYERYSLEVFYESGDEEKWSDLLISTNPYYFNDSFFSSTFRMDYSHGNGGDLNENLLYERNGLMQDSSSSIDWNGNGSSSDLISTNINPSYDSNLSTLSDYNDWDNLYFYYYYLNKSGSRSIAESNQEYVVEYDKPAVLLPLQRE